MKIRILVSALALASAVCLSGEAVAQSREALSHYNKGIDLFEKEQYTAAGVEFAKAAEELGALGGSDDGGYAMRTQYYQAICAAHTSKDNAGELLENFVEEYPNSIYLNDIHLELGTALEKQGRYEEAYAHLSQVAPFELNRGRRDEYYYRTGYAAYQLGDIDTAYDNFRRVESARDYLPHATYYIAYIDYTRKDLAAAKRGFQSLAADAAYAQIIPFYLLQIEFMEHNYGYVIEHAPALLEKATEVRGREISRILSESYFHMREYAEALRYIENYEALGGVMGPEELYLAGFCNRYQGFFDKAAGQLAQVAVKDGELGQNAAFHLADCYVRLGDKKRALAAFALAASTDYNAEVKEEAMFNQGKLQYELGGGVFNEAINILNNYVRTYPRSPRIRDAREMLLAAYFNTRNYEAAYEAIKLVEEPDNNVKTALQKISYFRGLEFFERGDYDRALTFFNEADANRFNAKYTALTKFWRAETLVRKGDYKNAAPLFREYINLSPASEYEHKVAMYDLAYCYFNMKDWADAASWFGRFTSAYKTKDDLLADAYNRMGDISFAQREYWKAIESYDKAVSLGSAQSDYSNFQRAVMLGLVDRRDRKIESLLTIISADKGDYVDDAMYELGRTYVQAERFNEGATVLKNLVARFPQSPFYLSSLSDLGLIYQNLGKDDEALRYYKQVVAASPTSTQSKDAMLGIQNIYVDRNDVNSYFNFAQSSGIETNITIVERDSLSYEAARRVYESGAHARALPLMDTYLRQFPRGAYRVDALYALGDCSLAEGNRQAAKSAFAEVGGMPESKYKSAALQKAARMEAEDGNYAAAAGLYRTLGSTSTQTPVITEALSGYLRNSLAAGDMAAANTAAQEVLASPFVTAELKKEANFIRARYSQSQGNDSEALALYRTVADARTANGAESCYQIAAILFKEGKMQESEKEILRFAEQNTPYQQWLGRSFLILGDIYLAQGDDFQAKATFQSIIDGYSDRNDGIVAEAEQKIEKLK